MAIYNKFTDAKSAPSSYSQYGEGSFQYEYHIGVNATLDEYAMQRVSLDGNLWFNIPIGGSWIRGDAKTLYEAMNNNNNKTWTTTDLTGNSVTPIYLNSINIWYVATATAGDRALFFEYKPFLSATGGAISLACGVVVASTAIVININKNGGSDIYDAGGALTGISVPFTGTMPYGGNIRFYDDNGVDGNDDFYVQIEYNVAIHKMESRIFRNCSNFCVEYFAPVDYLTTGRVTETNVINLSGSTKIDPKVWVNQ
jgi:hypothetical protein